MTQRFIEFMMMHAQNAAYSSNWNQKPAKLKSIWIREDVHRSTRNDSEKTRNNLTNEEAMVLRNPSIYRLHL